VRCKNHLDFQLLPVYKPVNALIKDCLAPCRFCGILYTNILLKCHEQNCPKTPVSKVVVEMTETLQQFGDRPLTVGDMNKYLVQRNLLHSFKGSVLPSLLLHSAPHQSGSSSEFITHVITDADTLVGLSLRYGVTQDDIRKINRLVGSAEHVLHGKTVLQIPKRNSQASDDNITGQDGMLMQDSMEMALKKRLAARFAKLTGCKSTTESNYYLEASNYDLDAAVAEYQVDVDWAKKEAAREDAPREPLIVEKPTEEKERSKNRSRCCFF